jgi:hypothetical protein
MDREPLVYTQLDPNTQKPIEQVQEEPQVVAEQVVGEPQEEPKVVEKKNDTREYNMRVLRERAEKAERALAERERLEAQRVQQPQHQSTPQSVPVVEEDFSVNDDDIIEGRHIKKYSQTVTREIKALREELKRQQQYQQQQQAMSKIQTAMPDFQNIVTEDSVKNLAAIYPDEYQAIGHVPDDYSRAKLAYTLIKNYGLSEVHAPEQTARIEENRSKPRTASAAPQSQQSTSPLSSLGDYDRRTLSEDRKAQLRKMVSDAKRYR